MTECCDLCFELCVMSVLLLIRVCGSVPAVKILLIGGMVTDFHYCCDNMLWFSVTLQVFVCCDSML